MNQGISYAAGAYALWGMLPIYWKLLDRVPATQLLGHRIIWSFLWLLLVLILMRQWKAFWNASTRWSVLPLYALAAILIGVNWFTYVWAVNAGFIVETSLGYFINPLLSVLIGVIFLKERLRPLQWVPVGIATIGILYLALTHGSRPWIALTLASTWAIYGLVKKTAPLDSLYGVALETGILFLPILIYLIHEDMAGQGAFRHAGLRYDMLMVGAGLITTIPLLMFASAARRIPLSVAGILQYICPTIQFFLGVLVYGEPFTMVKLAGFGIVWTALILFGLESFLAYRARVASSE